MPAGRFIAHHVVSRSAPSYAGVVTASGFESAAERTTMATSPARMPVVAWSAGSGSCTLNVTKSSLAARYGATSRLPSELSTCTLSGASIVSSRP